MPSGLRSRVPAKITSSIRVPRRDLADCSPSTHVMASLMLLLPQPLGPTTAAMPSPLKRNSVRSQKDLKPCSSTRFNFSKANTSRAANRGSCNYTKRAQPQMQGGNPLDLALVFRIGPDLAWYTELERVFAAWGC